MVSDRIDLGSKARAQSVWTKGRWIVMLCLGVPLFIFTYSWLTFPSDRTPEGAYLRIVKAVNQGKPEAFFAYTEEAAQHACFTIKDYRKKLLDEATKHYPEHELSRLQKEYGEVATASDGPEVFALMVKKEGWLEQLRRDVSGIERVEHNGPRATIVTSRGTRYAMRKRPGGIWGITAFTPALVDEAERSARDFLQVQKAARDFERAK